MYGKDTQPLLLRLQTKGKIDVIVWWMDCGKTPDGSGRESRGKSMHLCPPVSRLDLGEKLDQSFQSRLILLFEVSI